jgi:hypothetical protein
LRTGAFLFAAFNFFFCEDFFEEFDEDHGGMEVEEDRQWKRYPLDDDPRHKAVEVCLHQVCSHLLYLEGDDQPLSNVEEEQKDGRLTAGLGKLFVRWKNLKCFVFLK